MDISCKGEKFFGFDHFHGLFSYSLCRFLQVQFPRYGYDKHIVAAAFPCSYQSFENCIRIFTQHIRHIGAAYCSCMTIVMALVRYLFLIQHTHYVCLVFHIKPFCHLKTSADTAEVSVLNLFNSTLLFAQFQVFLLYFCLFLLLTKPPVPRGLSVQWHLAIP